MNNLLATSAAVLAGLSLSNFALADDYASETKAGHEADKKMEAKSFKKMKPMKKGMEKCYGIAKAGKNDCAAPDGKVSCAGSAKTDNEENAFILLPTGTCDRISGGMKK